MKKIFIALIFSIVFSACEKAIENNKCYLIEVKKDGNLYQSYTINDDNQLTSFVPYYNEDGEHLSLETYHYDSIGQLSRIEHITNSTIIIEYQYEYISEDTLKINRYSVNDSSKVLAGHQIIIFNSSSECLLKVVECYYSDGEFASRTTYDYTGLGCSCTARRRNKFGQVLSTRNIVTDEKNGATYWSSVPPYKEFMRHNIVESTSRTAGSSVEDSNPCTSVFRYNRYGFPRKEKRTYSDGTVVEYTYEYDCR